MHPTTVGHGEDIIMLTKLQRRVAALIHDGHTMDSIVDEGIVQRRTLKTWDLEAVQEEYRRSIALPPQEVAMEMRMMAGQALHTLRSCMAEGNPQTRLLAARYVLDAVIAQADGAGVDDDAGVAELRDLLTLVS
jgi:hypothetical protein